MEQTLIIEDAALEQVPGGLCLSLIGDLAGPNVAKFESRVQRAIEGGCQQLLVDFGRLRYINSTGIGALLAMERLLRRRKGRLLLAAVPPNALEIIQITGADALLEIHPTGEDARAAAGQWK